MDYKDLYEKLLLEHYNLTEKYNCVFRRYKQLVNMIKAWINV